VGLGLNRPRLMRVLPISRPRNTNVSSVSPFSLNTFGMAEITSSRSGLKVSSNSRMGVGTIQVILVV
jgi:hypothetical protein